MKIGIGADHRGFKTKLLIASYLRKQGHKVLDYGTDSEEPVDYPDVAFKVARDVAKKKTRFGILLCYSGQGMMMAANKVKGIRAALAFKPEYAKIARAHNNANILVLPAGFIKSRKVWQAIIKNFLDTKFDSGRHLRRLNIIKNYEKEQKVK